MNNLYPSEQQYLSETTAKQRFATLAQLDSSKGPVFMRSYSHALSPQQCSYGNVVELKQLIESTPSLSALTVRALKEAISQEQICLKIKTKMLLDGK